MTFTKSKLKELSYRDYKHINQEGFEKDLKYPLSTFGNALGTFDKKINYEEFEDTLIEILNKHSPVKKMLVRAN